MITTPGRPGGMAQFPKGVEIASFRNYEQAVKAVSKLGQEGIEVATISIVGSGLYIVEKVVGKVTPGKVALQGAGQGLTWGLFIGLMLMIFQPSVSIIWIGACIIMGICLGILLSAVSLLGSGKRRQYMARSQIMAGRYALLISSQADRAFQILQGFPGNLGPGGQAGAMPIRSPRATQTGGTRFGVDSQGDSAGANRFAATEDPQQFAAPSEPAQTQNPLNADTSAQTDTKVTDPAANHAPGAQASTQTPTGQQIEQNLAPTEFGSRPDEQPKFGVRLTPAEREQLQAQREQQMGQSQQAQQTAPKAPESQSSTGQ